MKINNIYITAASVFISIICFTGILRSQPVPYNPEKIIVKVDSYIVEGKKLNLSSVKAGYSIKAEYNQEILYNAEAERNIIIEKEQHTTKNIREIHATLTGRSFTIHFL
ncbi:MAG: hypothetical protein OEZ34_16065 [Spirochaetia bacterium]|nr:hypothetical protein [Spirochaetia bacterium]